MYDSLRNRPFSLYLMICLRLGFEGVVNVLMSFFFACGLGVRVCLMGFMTGFTESG